MPDAILGPGDLMGFFFKDTSPRVFINCVLVPIPENRMSNSTVHHVKEW